MEISDVLNDDQLKIKAKVTLLSEMLLSDQIACSDLIAAALSASGSARGTCIEAVEFATRTRPELASPDSLSFVTEMLSDPAPRVRWESAKVVRNIARLYPDKLDRTIIALLDNTDHSGTVVRWSAALALAEVLRLRPPNDGFNAAIEAIMHREVDTAIKKIYRTALGAASAKG